MEHKAQTILLAASLLPAAHGLVVLGLVALAGCRPERYRAVPTHQTPYDLEWEKVKKCLEETAALGYRRTEDSAVTWQLPTTTERLGCGDCTALATLLYRRMLRSGVRDGRIIFGFRGNSAWHAWVDWRGYILDPTVSAHPIEAAWGGYQPYWGYDLAGRYRFVKEPPAI